MNAVERLWRAIAARDWNGALAQFLPQAEVLWPHTGERMTAAEYVAVNRAYPGDWAIAIDRVVSAGEHVAVQLTVTDGDETHLCAGFFRVAIPHQRLFQPVTVVGILIEMHGPILHLIRRKTGFAKSDEHMLKHRWDRPLVARPNCAEAY